MCFFLSATCFMLLKGEIRVQFSLSSCIFSPHNKAQAKEKQIFDFLINRTYRSYFQGARESYSFFLLFHYHVHIFSPKIFRKTNIVYRISVSFILLQWVSFGHSCRVCVSLCLFDFPFWGQYFIIHYAPRQCKMIPSTSWQGFLFISLLVMQFY